MTRGPSVSERDIELVVRLLSVDSLTRTQLREAVNEERDHPLSDSAVRVVVEEARTKRHLVICAGGGRHRTYKIAESFEEYLTWRAEHASRIATMSAQLRHMDETASRTWPEQLRLVA